MASVMSAQRCWLFNMIADQNNSLLLDLNNEVTAPLRRSQVSLHW
jgi:hypothetical protein